MWLALFCVPLKQGCVTTKQVALKCGAKLKTHLVLFLFLIFIFNYKSVALFPIFKVLYKKQKKQKKKLFSPLQIFENKKMILVKAENKNRKCILKVNGTVSSIFFSFFCTNVI